MKFTLNPPQLERVTFDGQITNMWHLVLIDQ